MKKAVKTGIVADEGVDRVFVGIPDFTAEGAEIRKLDIARIQALTTAREMSYIDKDGSPEATLRRAVVYEQYLLHGVVPASPKGGDSE